MLRRALCSSSLAVRALAGPPTFAALNAPKALIPAAPGLSNAFHSSGRFGWTTEPPRDATTDTDAAPAVASAGDSEASNAVPSAQVTSSEKVGVDQSAAGDSFDFDDLSAEEFATVCELNMPLN